LPLCRLPVLQAVLQYVRRSSSMLDDWDMWGSGFTAWPDVLLRRSALQFLVDMQLGQQAGVCPSVTDRLQRCGCCCCLLLRMLDVHLLPVGGSAPQG
jgi:hypothetical protein